MFPRAPRPTVLPCCECRSARVAGRRAVGDGVPAPGVQLNPLCWRCRARGVSEIYRSASRRPWPRSPMARDDCSVRKDRPVPGNSMSQPQRAGVLQVGNLQ